VRTTKLFRNRKRSDHKLWKRKWVFFEATKKRSNNLKKLFHAVITIKPKSVEPERAFFSRGAICNKIQKQTEWWKCALIVIHQYYPHHWKTVPNLINNSLTNCAVANCSNFTVIFSFIAQNRIHFKTRKKLGFPGFLLSATRNPSFKILPWIGNTSRPTYDVFLTFPVAR